MTPFSRFPSIHKPETNIIGPKGKFKLIVAGAELPGG
jgi:hypothetical protein